MRAIMGRLSPFEGGLVIGLAVIMSIAVMPSIAAPVQETTLGRYANEKGCYYFNKHYPSGENIHTNEPCLNCTCVGSTLMCYLRVCPMVKPLGANCKSVMHVGDCCPQYWCPEAYPRSSTEKPETEVRGCFLDDKYYDEGARIPMDPMKPCEVCYCIRNTSVCTTQQCELKVDGCFPQYKAGMCCPSRYNCTEDAATTIPPGVMEPEDYEGCKVGGVLYKDGEQVPSLDECENCYCMKHEVVCAVQECKAPADNCVPQATPEGQCCPDKYDCPSGTEIPEWATTHMVATEDLLRNVTTPVDLEHKFTSIAGLTTPAIKIQDHTLLTGTDLDTQTLSVVLSTVSDAKTITGEPARRVEDEAAETTTAEVTSLSEVFTETVITENATLHPADLVSRPREPKITEVPDEMFSSVTIANVTTGRPIFYRPGIPGEGICRQNDVIYQNREEVPSIDPCRLNCRCVNSVIKCDHVECVLSPPGSNCKVTRDPEECCPKYVCDTPADITTRSDQFTHMPTVIQQEQEQITISDVLKATDKEKTTIMEKAVTSKQEQEEITFKEESITESVIKFTTLSSSTSSPTKETGQKEVEEVDFTPTVMSFTSTESKTEISEAKMATVASEIPVMMDVKSTESIEASELTDIEQPSKATESVEIVTLEDDNVVKGMKEETTIAPTVRSSTATPSALTEHPETSIITKEEEIVTPTSINLTTTLKESSEGVFIEATLRPSEELATDSEIKIKADAAKATSVAEDITSMKLTTEEAVTAKSTVEITGVVQENGTERTQSLEIEMSTAVTTQTARDTESALGLTVEDAEPSEVTKFVSEGMSTKKEKEIDSFTQQTAKEPAFEESTSKSITQVVSISDTIIEEKEKVETSATQTTKGPVGFDSTPKLATEMSTVEDISESVSEELETEKMKVEGSTPETSKEYAIREPASKLTTVEIESTTEVTQAINAELSTEVASIQSLAPPTAKDTTIIGSTPKTTTETSVSLEEITKSMTDSVSTERVETETILAEATTVLDSASKSLTEVTTPSEGASKAVSDELSTEDVKAVASDSQIDKGTETEESKSTTKLAETSDKIIKDKGEVSTENALILQDTKVPSIFDYTPKSTTASEGITESVSEKLSTEKMKDKVLTSETAVTESASELTIGEEQSTKQVTQVIREELSTEIMEVESLAPEIAKETSTPNVTIQAEVSPEEITEPVTERVSTESVVAETLDAQAIETTSVIGYTTKFKTESTQPSEKTTIKVFSTEGLKVETVTSQTTKEPETLELTSKLSTEKIIPSLETTKVASSEVITEITQAGTIITELTTAPIIFSSTSKLLTTDAVSHEKTTKVTEELSLETLEPESIVPETAEELENVSSTPKSTAEMISEEATKSISESTERVKIELFTPQATKETVSLESDLKSTVGGESTEKTTKITTKKASTEISEDETISFLTTKEHVFDKSITTEAAAHSRETTKSVSQEESTDVADTETTSPIILDSTFKLTTGEVTSSDETPEPVSKDTDTESVDMKSFTPRVTKEPDTSKITTEEAESTKESTKVVSIETIEAKIVTPQTSKEYVSKLATTLTTESTEAIRGITKADSEETSGQSADIETLGAETTEMPKILDFTSELTTGIAEFLEEATKAVSVDLEAKPFTLHSTQDPAIIETISELAPKETKSSNESTSFVSETTSEKVSEAESVISQTAKKTTVFEITTKLTTKAVEPLGQTTKFVSEEASTFSVGTEIKETETTKVPSLLDFTSKLTTETIESSKEVTKPFSTIEDFESSTEHAVTEFTSRLTTEQRTPIQETTETIIEDVRRKTLSPQTIKESLAVTTSAVATTEKSSSMGITPKDVSEERSTVSMDTEMKDAGTTKPTMLDISSRLTIEETELSEGTTSFSKDLITESFDTESVTPQTTKESTVIGFTSKLTTDKSTNEADGIITKISESTSIASQTVKEPIVIESKVKLTTEADVHLEETTKSMKEDESTFSVVTETAKAEATKAPVIEDAPSKLLTEKAELPEELTETISKDLITDSIVIDSFTTHTSRAPSIVELTSKVTIEEAKSTTEAAELVSGEVSTKTLAAESVAPQTAKETIVIESDTKFTTAGATVFRETTKAVTKEPSTHNIVPEILKTEATKSSAIFDSTFKFTTELVPSSEEVTKVMSTDLSRETIETPKTTEVPIMVESTSKLTAQETEPTEETIKHLSEEISTEIVKTQTIVPQTAKEPEYVETTTKLITEMAAPLGEETKSVSEEVATSSVDTEMFHTETTKPTSFDITSKLGTEKTEPSESTTETSSKHISTKIAELELSTSQTSQQPVVVESTTKLTIEETESLESTTETSSKDISTQTAEFESVKSTTKLTIKEAEPTKVISLDISAETIEAESITPQTTKEPSVSKSTTKFTTKSSAAVSETTKVIGEGTSVHSVDVETVEAEATESPEKSTEEPAAVVSVDVSSTTSETKSIISQTSKEPLTIESTVKLTTEVSALAAETTKSVSDEESSSSVLETEATKAPVIPEFTSTLAYKEIESSELTKGISKDISTESVITESFRPQTVSESVTMKTTSELILQEVESTTGTSKSVSEEQSIKSLEDETIIPQTSAVEVISKLTTDAISDFSAKETSATHTMKTSVITESTSKLTTEATMLPKEIIKDIGDDALSTESEVDGTFFSETTKAPAISEFDAEESSTESVGAQTLASRDTKGPAFVQNTSKLTTEATESVTITPTSVESSSHLTSEVETLTERITKFISTELSSESDEALKATIQTTEEPEIISSTFKSSFKEATVVPLEETRSVSEMTSTDVVDIKSITQSTTEATGETTRAAVEDVTHELRTATTKLSDEISTHEPEVKLTTFRPADTEETTKHEIKMITKLPIIPDEETWKSEIKNQTKVTAISTEETTETETKLTKFTEVGVISPEITSSAESEKFTKQATVSTALSTETSKTEEVTHKLPSKSPEVDGEMHELTTLETLSKITQKSEVEDVEFKLTTKSETFTETPKIALSEITEVPIQKITESALLEETTFKAVTGGIEQMTNITTVSQTIKSSEAPKSTPEFEIGHPVTLKHTEIDSEALETTKYIVGVTSKTTAFFSLDDSGTTASITQAAKPGKQSIPELITKEETVAEEFETVTPAIANATGFEIKISTTDATEIVEGESTSKMTAKIYTTTAEDGTPVTSTTDVQAKVLTPKITTAGDTFTERMRTKLFDDEVSTDIEALSSKFTTEISSKVTETKVSTPVTTVAEGEEVSQSTTKTEDSESTDFIKTTTKYPQIEDVTLTVTMEKDREEFETSSIQTTTEIAESTQKSKMTSEVTYTETPLATKGGEVQDVTSNFTLPEIDITEQVKTKSTTEQPTTAIDILSTMKSVPSKMPETAISDAHSISENEDITSKLIVFTESTTKKVSSVQTTEGIGVESTKEITKETVSDFFETEMSTLQSTIAAQEDEGASTVHTTIADDIKTPRPTTAHVTEPAESHKTVSATKAPQTDDKKQETTTVSTKQMEAETQKTETTLDEELEEFKLKLSSQFAPFSDDLDIETSSIIPLETESKSTAISTELIESSRLPVSETPATEEVKITKVEEPSEPSKIFTSIATSSETIHISKQEATTFKLPTTSQEDYIVGKTTGSDITEVTIAGFPQPEKTKKTEKPTTEISISSETARAASEEELIKARLTTLTEISETGDAAEKGTEGVSVISEETILSNRTFAADAMLAHSTIAMSTMTEASQTKTEKSTVSDFVSSYATSSPSEESTSSFSTEGSLEITETAETIFKETSSVTEKAKQDYRTTLAALLSTRDIITEVDVSTEKLETTSEQTEVVTQFTSTSKEFISSPETDTDIDVATKMDTLHPATLDSNLTTYAKETPSDFKSISTISEAFPSQISTIAGEEINETQMELGKTQTSSKLATATEKFTAGITSIVSSTNVVFDETSFTSTVHTPTETVSEITSQDQTSLDSVSAVSVKDIKDITSVIATTSYSETTLHESPTTTTSVEVLSEKDTRKGETVTPEGKLIEEGVASTLSLENGTIESSPAVSTSLEILGFTGKSTAADKTISTDMGDFTTSTMKPEIITKEDITRKISLEDTTRKISLEDTTRKISLEDTTRKISLEDTTRKTSLEDITESSQPEKITTSYTEMETEEENVTFDEFSSSATPMILTEGISEISTFRSPEIGEQTKSSVPKISTEVLAAEETTKVPSTSKSTKFASDEVTEKFTAETKAVEAAISVTDTYPDMTNISSTEMQILLEVTSPAGIFSEKKETDVPEFTSSTVSKEEVFVDTEDASVKLPVSTEIITESTAVHMKTTSEIKPDTKVADDVTMIWKSEKPSEAEESSKTVESETTLALKTSPVRDHFRTTDIYISEKPSVAGVEKTEMMVSTPLTRIPEKTTESVFEVENVTTISELIPGKEKMPTTVTSIYEGKVSEQTLSSSTDRISITETASPLVSKILDEDETSTDEKILSTLDETEKRKSGADMPIISTTVSRRFESTVKVTEPTSIVTESTSSTATTPYPEVAETEAIGIVVTTETSEGTPAKDLTEKDVPFPLVTSSVIPKDATEIEEGETVIESGCLVNETMYGDGEAIDSVEPCEKCHCSSGDVVCFKVICKLPKAGCIPKTTSTDECCPSSYDCPTDGEKVETVTITSTLKVTEKDFTTPIPISFMFSSTPASIASTVLITKPSDQPLPEATIEKDYTTGTEDTDVSITTHVPTDAFLETSGKTSERSAVTESAKYSTQEPHATATQSAVEEHSTTTDIRPGTPRFISDSTSIIPSTATISESGIKTTIELTSTVPEFDVTQSKKLPHAVDLATEGPSVDETSSLVSEKETKIIFDKVSTTHATAYLDTDMTEESKVVTISGETIVTEGKAYPHSTTAEPTKEKEPEILTVTSTETGNISQEATKLPVTTIEMSDSHVTYKSTETTGYSEEQGTETELARATEIVSTKLSEDTINKSIEISDVKSSTISTMQTTEGDEVPKTSLKVTGIPTITDTTREKEILLKTTGVPAVAKTVTEKEIIIRTTGILSVTDAATEKEIPLKTTGVPTTADTTMEKEIIFKTTDISAVTAATTEEEIRLKPTGVPTTAGTTMKKEITLKTTDISVVTKATTEEEIHLKPKHVLTVTDKTTEKDILLKTAAGSDITTEKEILPKTTIVSAETETTTEKEITLKTTDISVVTEATTEEDIHLKPKDLSTVTNKTTEKEIPPQTTDVSAASDLTTEREILLKTTSVSVITDEAKDKEVRFPVVEAEDRIISTTISDHTHSIPSETSESILQKESTKEMAAEEITPMSTALPSKLPKFDDFVTSTSSVPAEKLTTAKSFTTETVLEAETTSKPFVKDVTTATKGDETEGLFRGTESTHDIKKVTFITESVSTDAFTSTSSSTTVPTLSSEAFDLAKRNTSDHMQSEVSVITSTLSTLHPFISTTLTTIDLATSTDKDVDHVTVTGEQAIRKTTVPEHDISSLNVTDVSKEEELRNLTSPITTVSEISPLFETSTMISFTVSEKLPEKSQTQINETGGFDAVLPTGDVFSAPRDETSTPAGSSTHASTLTAETSKVPMYIPSLIPQEIDSVTETAQINQTILSLSKEGLSTVSAERETTEEELSDTSMEIKISEKTTVSSTTTEKQSLETIKESVIPKTASPTIERDTEIQTTISDEPSTTFDRVSTTDKVFTFVSTRFTDVTTESIDTETIHTTEHDISTLNVTDLSKKEELKNLTSSATTVSETSPLFETSTKISFTTRKPALKSVDDSLPSISPYDIDLANLTEIQEQEELSTKSSITTLTPAITIYKEEEDLAKTAISSIETKTTVDIIDESTTVDLAKDTFPASTYDFTVPHKEISTDDEKTSIAASIATSSVPTEETTLKEKSTIETTEVEKEISVSVSEQFTTYDHDISPKTHETHTEDKIYVANLTTLSEDIADITFASDNETMIITTHRKFADVTSAAEETTPSPHLKTSIPAISFTTFLDDLNATKKITDESLETISSKDAFETITAKASEQTSGAILTEQADTITSDIRSTTPFISKVETSAIEKALVSTEQTDIPTQTEVTESTTFSREISAKVSDITVSTTFVEDIVTEKLPDVTKGATKNAIERTTLVPTIKDTTLEEESLMQNMSSVTTKSDIAADITAQSTTVQSKATTIHEVTEQARQDVTGLLTKAYKAIETTPTPFTVTAPALDKEEETTAVPEQEDDFLLDEGSCIFEGRIYESAEQIPRADPCEFCFCFRGDIICLQQSCPPPAPNCHRTMIAGYCCPRYDCPVYMTSRNISSLSRRKGVQPIIIQRRIEKREIRPAVEVKGCQVNGTFYEVGSTVTSASGPCLHCMCQDGGIMRCDPRKCKPQAPLMLKMNNSFFRSRR